MKTKTSSLIAVTSAAMLMSGTCFALADTLTFVSYAGVTQDSQISAWQEPFTAETGVTFQNDAPPEGAKLKAMVESGKVTWDVIDQGAPFAEQYCGTYLQKIDLTGIDVSQFPKGSVTDCGIPIYFYGLTFVYNSEKYKDNPPTKVADFFDLDRFPGTRVLPPDMSDGVLEYALMADGVKADQLYPIDVDRALRKLDTIKSSIIFASTNGVLQQTMVDEQADMGFMPTGRVAATLASGAKIAPVWDVTVLSWDSLMVPKDTPNAKRAMEFVAFATKPEQNAIFVEKANLAAANTAAKPNYTEMQKQVNPMLNTQNGASVILSDVKWWSKNLDGVIEKVTPWKSR